MNASMMRVDALSQQPSIDVLAVRHYEQLYAFFNAFHDDAALCLDLTTQTLRDAEACDLTTVCVFSKAVARLSRQPGMSLPVEAASYEKNLAWLLKDVGGLRYSEIGMILHMSREAVKEAIADVRWHVLERLAA